ncbi:MAG: hypothetical protein ACFHU9_17215 [Fluviicola sp.]
MKVILLLVAGFCAQMTSAQPGPDTLDPILQAQIDSLNKPIYRGIQAFDLTDSTYNAGLRADQAVYHFDFTNLLPEDSNAMVHYSVDSSEYRQALQKGRLSVATTPGTHRFQMYINSNYTETFSPFLRIEPQVELTYSVGLAQLIPGDRIITFKPVIYLYPEQTTNVSVALNIHHGKSPFYYPEYKGKWECTANPEGNLEVDGNDYRYLFWEAEQADHLSEIDVNEGFVVPGSDAVSFLEEKLKHVGFTSEERADFITFWGPKLAANENNLVHFEWNESCNKFADLNISPEPDHIYRFYIFLTALDSKIAISPQTLPVFNREGFVALEWGGQISNYQPTKSL